MAHRIFLFNLVSLKNQRRQTGSIQAKTGMAHRGEDKIALRMAIDSNANPSFGEVGQALELVDQALELVGRECVGLVCSMIKVLGNKYEETEPALWPTSGSRTN
jgi:hypothetical protein